MRIDYLRNGWIAAAELNRLEQQRNQPAPVLL